LKVGPALTFALREAIFALANIEQALVSPDEQSQVMAVIDRVMLDEPDYWKKYYHATFSRSLIDLHFSLSDRIRYYWPHPHINHAVEALLHNLQAITLPLGLLSQFMPIQFERVMSGELGATPHELIIDKIQDVLRAYRYGCTVTPVDAETTCHA